MLLMIQKEIIRTPRTRNLATSNERTAQIREQDIHSVSAVMRTDEIGAVIIGRVRHDDTLRIAVKHRGTMMRPVGDTEVKTVVPSGRGTKSMEFFGLSLL